MKIIYITTEGISSTVFESQVLALKRRLELKGIKPTLIIGQKIKARISPAKLFRLNNDKSNHIIFIRDFINHHKVAKKIYGHIMTHEDIVIHCRNIDAAYIGYILKQKFENKNIQVLYDVRGYLEGEALYFKDEDSKKRIEELNKMLYSSDIYFNFVSEELYNLYNNKHSINPKRVLFCNSAYDDKVFKLSESQTVTHSEIVKILYVGGNQGYQKIEGIISSLKERGDVELTVVTSKPIYKKNKKKNVKFLSNLKPEQINVLSDEFDYGIIYRSNEIFNQVATPTKVTEYWGKGLKVIAVNSAGAYTKTILKDSRLGIIVGSENELLTIPLQKTTFSEKQYINKVAKDSFSQSVNIEKYLSLYNEMLKKKT